MRPLVGFYAKHKIVPVSQNISNLAQHFQRRDHLYRYLGIAPNGFEGKSIIEFGPGAGHNALFPLRAGVAKLTLVDGNEVSMEKTKELVGQYFGDSPTEIRFEFSLIEEFETDERFDIVLGEGFITHQIDPAAFTRHIAKFVKPGGVLVITTSDPLSNLPEVLRRVMRDFLMPENTEPDEQFKVLTPILSRHYDTLPGISRPIEECIWDNIINPWRNDLYSFEQAITTLGDQFDFLGSSPRFHADWRWYKQIVDTDPGTNEQAIAGYRANACNFIDCRVELGPRPEIDHAAIMSLAAKIYRTMARTEKNGTSPTAADYQGDLESIMAQLPEEMARTKESCDEFIQFMENPRIQQATDELSNFASWFGRAQQYMSFVRRMDY